jgi:hypothetical protein
MKPTVFQRYGLRIEGVQVQRLAHRARHLVVDAEAALLHDDAALLLEVLLRDREVRHAVALEVEHQRQAPRAGSC